VTGRTFDPASFINRKSCEALSALPVKPWDVVTAAEFLRALGVEDKMMVNRWIYRGCAGVPPFEPLNRWRVGSGGPRVIRKDRAMAWARTRGKSVSARDCWPDAAAELREMGWPGLSDPEDVQQVLGFLLASGIVNLAVQLHHAREIDRLYV
jgi:hypothetical protein